MPIRVFEMAKFLTIKSAELVNILLENDIIKNNFSKIDGEDLICICHLLFNKSIELQTDNIEIYNKKIIEMARHPKYHNTLKFLVHMINDKKKRKIMIGQIALIDPFFSAQILMTICENIDEEKDYLLQVLRKMYYVYNNKFNKFLLIMSFFELEECEAIEKIFSKSNELEIFCNVMSSLSRFFVDTEKQLVLIELLMKQKKFDEIGIILKDIDSENFDKMQIKKAIFVSEKLNGEKRYDLSIKLLTAAGEKRKALEAFNCLHIDNNCVNEKIIDNYCSTLKLASNVFNNTLLDVTEKLLGLCDFLIKNKVFFYKIVDVLNSWEEVAIFNNEHRDRALAISKKLENVKRFDLSYRLLVIADLDQEAIKLLRRVNLSSFCGNHADFKKFFNVVIINNHLNSCFAHNKEQQSELLDLLIKCSKRNEEIEIYMNNMEDARSCLEFGHFFDNNNNNRHLKVKCTPCQGQF